MDPNTVEAISIVAFLAAVVTVVRLVLEALTRRRLLSAPVSEETMMALLRGSREDARDGALRWGIVLTAVGAALVAVELLPIDLRSPAAYGLLMVAGGAGLLVYRRVAPADPERLP